MHAEYRCRRKEQCLPTGIWLVPRFGRSFAETEKDYGLNPTASTHSGGAVALAGNPYTIKLWMADMGKPWTTHLVGGKCQWVGTGFWNPVGGDPQTSIFLCNSPTTLSFTIRPAWLQVFLRSVDFEVPAHARPWTFPGSEIWLEFKDESGATVDRTDPTVDGFIQDAGTTYGNPGVGYPIPGVDYLAPEGVQVGYGVTPYDYDNSVPACPPAETNCAGYHSVLRYTYAGIDWTSAPAWNSYPLYRALYNGGHRPTRLPPGPYMVDVHTHGYVLRRAFPVQVPAEGGADIQADLIQGAQIRVIMSFKHEDVKTPFNGFVRMEVLNEAGDLVGASVYGTAEPNRFTELGAGGAYFSASPDDPYWSWTYGDSMKTGGPAGGAGFGDPYTLYPSASPGQRAMWSNLYYGVPYCPDMRNPACQVWASWDYTSPLDANKFGPTDTLVVDVFGFYWYHGDAARTWAGGWPTTNGLSNSGKQVGANGLAWDSGLRGSDDLPNWAGSGGGTYTVKIYAFDYDAQRMYAMGWPLSGISVPWGGADDQYVDMNALATLKGTVSWLDMYGTFRYLPWAQISASPGPGDNTMAYGTPGYLMWLPAGSHDVSVSTSEAPGVWGGPAEQNGQYTVVVSNGWVGGGESRLDHTGGVPVPELPVYVLPFGLLAVLGAAVWLLRKQNLNTPVLMK